MASKKQIAGKMNSGYTMNAVTPSSKSKGQRYSQHGGVDLPSNTMNASPITGKGGGQSYTQHGGGSKSGGGMKATQANKKANFSSNYSQNGKK